MQIWAQQTCSLGGAGARRARPPLTASSSLHLTLTPTLKLILVLALHLTQTLTPDSRRVQEQANLEDIARFFANFELMGNPVTMVKEVRTLAAGARRGFAWRRMPEASISIQHRLHLRHVGSETEHTDRGLPMLAFLIKICAAVLSGLHCREEVCAV